MNTRSSREQPTELLPVVAQRTDAPRRHRELTPAEQAWLRGEPWPVVASGAADDPAPRGRRFGRRALGLGALGVGATVAAGRLASHHDGLPGALGPGGAPAAVFDPSEPHASCADPGSLLSTGKLGAATLGYEISGRPERMRFEPGFHGQLGRWLADWEAAGHPRVTRVDSYGAFVAKDDCRSWHAAGRAFDIARLSGPDGTQVSCRTDRWAALPPERRALLRRRYWALAASLHLHFAYVLTHHFDPLHANHIHVDNGISGGGMSRVDQTSRVQAQAVQAICATLWSTPGEVTGEWSDANRQVGPVLDRLNLRSLSRQDDWHAFLRASMARA